MDERWTNIDSTSFLVSAECCCVGLCLWDGHWTDSPSKHYNAGQSHGASAVSMLAHRLRRWPNIWSACYFPANTRRWTNVVLMSGRRRRRRANIQTTFTWTIVSCLQGWCSLQVMCLIQICKHRGRYMHTTYVHGDSTVYQLRPTLSGWYCWCFAKVTCHAWRHLI